MVQIQAESNLRDHYNLQHLLSTQSRESDIDTESNRYVYSNEEKCVHGVAQYVISKHGKVLTAQTVKSLMSSSVGRLESDDMPKSTSRSKVMYRWGSGRTQPGGQPTFEPGRELRD